MSYRKENNLKWDRFGIKFSSSPFLLILDIFNTVSDDHPTTVISFSKFNFIGSNSANQKDLKFFVDLKY